MGNKKLKVLLISPEFSLKETKGLARYSLELYNRIKKFAEVRTVFRKKFHRGILGFLYSLLYSNFLVLLEGRKYDVIHAISPELSFTASLFYRKKTITTFHDLFPILYWKKLKLKMGFLVYILSYFVWKIAARSKIIVANSSLTKEQIRKVFKRESYVILEGIDMNKFKKTREKNKELTLCFVGNYSYRKRVDMIIKLYRKLKKEVSCKLIIVGGKLKSVYYTNFDLSSIKDENIIILDKVSDAELLDVYSQSHFLIFPSITEGFGLPILEALSCDTLSITFEFSEIPKEVKEVSLECKDLEDAKNKIITLWKDKKSYMKILKKFKTKLKSFSWNKAAKQYLNLYRKLLLYE